MLTSSSLWAVAPIRSLFWRYSAFLVTLVGVALSINTGVNLYYSYLSTVENLKAIQKEKVIGAAGTINQFVKELEGQLRWATGLGPKELAIEQRRLDYARLLRQAPAITEVSFIDADGIEQLKISRLDKDIIGRGVDLSSGDAFRTTKDKKTYVSPIYFKKDSEPYISLAVSGASRSAGITVAEVNLKFVREVISKIELSRGGTAYIVDQSGFLVAHPDMSMVLRKTNIADLPIVRAALERRTLAKQDAAVVLDIDGKEVLSTYAPIPGLDWFVFIDLPINEARRPIYEALARSTLVLLVGLLAAVMVGLWLAKLMVVPIRKLAEGAGRVGAGDLSYQIDVRSGDELQKLADSFNQMASQLLESRATLEQKVVSRTEELTQALQHLQTMIDVGQVINSNLASDAVLSSVISNARKIAMAVAGGVYTFDAPSGTFNLAAAQGVSEDVIQDLSSSILQHFVEKGNERILAPSAAIEIPDLENSLPTNLNGAGIRALLAQPLSREGRMIGVLILLRASVGAFGLDVQELMKPLAAQSALALQNARLFRDLEEKSAQLEAVSQHKSQFLANMSHELRTPLNAILGYNQLMLDGLYGEPPPKFTDVLERVQRNGKHLLDLINDVLDLSKIEAGQLVLSLDGYSMKDVLRTAISATESLAYSKGLTIKLDIQDDMPPGWGDERRITQVILNLVGNAIKFTDVGIVNLSAHAEGGEFFVAVSDTGPGIPEREFDRIFEEFHQVDGSSTKKNAGTGLGLAIARRIVDLHGGRLWVESRLGEGSKFVFALPVRAQVVATHP